MDSTTVIKQPLITEKSTEQTEHNRYGFLVDRRADKQQIRRAVEGLYKVRVISVSTANRLGKIRRTKFGYSQTPTTKRAIVKIHPEDRIELF